MNIKSRNTGLVLAQAFQIALKLKKGHTIAIASIIEDDYCDRILNILKEVHYIDAVYERTTRKKPTNNLQIIHNRFSEPIGMDILPQEDAFSGWIIKRKE